jgi:hypothetical protein
VTSRAMHKTRLGYRIGAYFVKPKQVASMGFRKRKILSCISGGSVRKVCFSQECRGIGKVILDLEKIIHYEYPEYMSAWLSFVSRLPTSPPLTFTSCLITLATRQITGLESNAVWYS